MQFFIGNKIIDAMLMIFYISLAIGTLSSIADCDGPIQRNGPDR